MNARFIRGCWTTLIALCLPALSSCATAPQVTQPKERAPAEMRQECPKPPKLDDSKPMLVGDFVQADIDTLEDYKLCAKRVEQWIKWEAGRK